MESNIQNSSNYDRYAPQDYYIAFTRETKWHENLQAHVSMYMVDERTATKQLELLIVAFTFSNLEEIYERLIKGTFQGYGTDYVEIHNKNNTVTIKHPANSWGDEIQVSTTNFTEMIEAWNKLRQEDTETIYFILKPNRTILVQKNLDGAHVAEVQAAESSTSENLTTSSINSQTAIPEKPLARPSLKQTDGVRYLIFIFRHTENRRCNSKVCIQFASTYSNLEEDGFNLFDPLFTQSNLDEVYEFLQKPFELLYKNNVLQIYKDNDSVIIEGLQQGYDEKQLVVKIDNLMTLLTEWKSLIDQDPAEIYILEKGDSPIVAIIDNHTQIVERSLLQKIGYKIVCFLKNIF